MESLSSTSATEVPRIARDVFSADELPPRERFTVWREAVLPLFDCATDDIASFTASLEGYDLRQSFLSVSQFEPLHYRRPARHAPAQGADHLLVQLYLEGGYVGENGRYAVKVEPGDISLLDLAHPLSTRTTAAKVMTLVMPRGLLSAASGGRQGWKPGTVLRAGTPMASILGHHLRTVWDAMPHLSVAESEQVNRMVASVVAAAFTGEAGNGAPETDITGAATAAAIRDYLLANLESRSLTPAHLCRRFGCSRSQLYRLFAEEGGVAGLIRRARLERCRDELLHAGDGVRILDVAMRWGFDNHSHFCRLFRREFGISPREAVAQGRAAARTMASAPRRRAVLYRPAFHQWLRQLSA